MELASGTNGRRTKKRLARVTALSFAPELDASVEPLGVRHAIWSTRHNGGVRCVGTDLDRDHMNVCLSHISKSMQTFHL